MNDNALCKLASEARESAYARYSQFAVGSAILTTDGRTFTGCNIENASSRLTICAEQSALANAVVAGNRQFLAIAIAASGGVAPCGACRQTLAEFCDDSLRVLIANATGQLVRQTTLGVLLPDRFSAASRTHSS
jgi:cytidine deaminase